jgi:hypothetical protein
VGEPPGVVSMPANRGNGVRTIDELAKYVPDQRGSATNGRLWASRPIG